MTSFGPLVLQSFSHNSARLCTPGWTLKEKDSPQAHQSQGPKYVYFTLFLAAGMLGGCPWTSDIRNVLRLMN